MTAADDERFLRAAIDLARENVAHGGRPFGALVVKNGAVIATGVNEIIATHDPTAHAELGAIRAASRKLGSPDLSGCVVYASGQPCPMCMAAMRMAGVVAVAFACSNADGEPFGLSTEALRRELALPFAKQSMAIRHVPIAGASGVYAEWRGRQRHPA
ncbi:nucleoside deaminase [Sphingomonas sp. CL5.1]|uniref:nucleoside deaminase n=1 Tax=Sphingomonas sp. CL5.1 TaxID=2653203 RepID=UPI0015843250|nr:nucleoside deaminase [Sphingomonas sp. CL5.1]QKS00545.1 nucleoside deaminase [Sphingomonas sp. CL5.1]